MNTTSMVLAGLALLAIISAACRGRRADPDDPPAAPSTSMHSSPAGAASTSAVERARAVERNQLSLVKRLDSYDATRLLLVPEALRPGEEVATIVSDERTLAIYPVPPDGSWSEYGALARKWWTTAAPSSRLLDWPLRVTSSGYEVK